MKLILAIVNNDDSAIAASLYGGRLFRNKAFHYRRIFNGR